MAHVVVERVLSCRSSAAALWPAVADTERTNRAIGMEVVTYKPLAGATAGRFLGQTRLGGVPVSYEERPTEWVEHRWFQIHRIFQGGPTREMKLRFEFSERAQGCELKLVMHMDFRVGLLGPLFRGQVERSVDAILNELRQVDERIAQGQQAFAIPPVHAHDEETLARGLKRMAASVDEPLRRDLARLIREGDDAELISLRPFALADGWKRDRLSVLGAMLLGVEAGLFELRWELVCPSCRSASETSPSLGDLKTHAACQLCELQFEVELDDAVEATFAPHPGVRKAEAGPFCIAGPARTPHVVAQTILPALGSAELIAPAVPGRYRLFVRGGRRLPIEVVEEGDSRLALTLSDLSAAEGDKAPTTRRVAPGSRIGVANSSGDERHMKLERAAWPRQAATAREVTSLPAFRRAFSRDLLRSGTSLKASRVTLFFSDLTGSTQLYSDVGDAAAFRLVHDHFEVVQRVIESHNGALIKTIGDAVMAVFARPSDALTASLALLEAFETFRAAEPMRQRTHIKLGLFEGPAYLFTANGVLDYFGQSVNVAARLQAQAESGQLVAPAHLIDEALTAGSIPANRVVERYEARLKGVDHVVPVARLR